MIRNIVVASASAVVLALAIVFQVTATTSHEVKDDGARTSVQAPQDPSGSSSGEDRPETNDQSGKPGETK